MTTDIQFLADCILASDYFNDADAIAYPPFHSDPAPTLRTFDDLDAYAAELPFSASTSLRDRLIDMLDLDIRDLAHNANYDAFLDDDITRELSDDDFDDIHRILNDCDNNIFELIADALLSRAFDLS